MARRRRSASKSTRGVAIAILAVFLTLLAACAVVAVVFVQRQSAPTTVSGLALRVAYSPEKGEVFDELVRQFNDQKRKLPNGDRVTVLATQAEPDEIIEMALADRYQAVCPDTSIWLGEIDRRWRDASGSDLGLIGETTRFMVSPVVIAMWPEVARSLGYPERELGWQDLLRAAIEDTGFRWSHPSTNTASGLLATLAQFYVGAGVQRGLTEEQAKAEQTLEYVARIEKTVKHYGEGEEAVMARIGELGRSYLDAFVVQEQMVVRHNTQAKGESDRLVAIYPAEGTLWQDHPLALLEHPGRSDAERLAYRMFREYLLAPDAQLTVLRYGYRPTDLGISLDHPSSPIKAVNGADPTKPYTTLQIPSPSVIAVVRDVWWYTKRHTNVYLVVDVSGSMSGRKLADAQEALRTFLAQVEGDLERVGLITFASSAQEIVPLTQLGEGRADLERAIDRLTAQGNTALIDGVHLALVKLQDLRDVERINAIVVMTDGRENRSRATVQEVAEKLRLAAKSDLPVVVFCIAYGRDADLDVLRAFSDAAGGFTREGDEETIRTLYKTLSSYF